MIEHEVFSVETTVNITGAPTIEITRRFRRRHTIQPDQVTFTQHGDGAVVTADVIGHDTDNWTWKTWYDMTDADPARQAPDWLHTLAGRVHA